MYDVPGLSHPPAPPLVPIRLSSPFCPAPTRSARWASGADLPVQPLLPRPHAVSQVGVGGEEGRAHAAVRGLAASDGALWAGAGRTKEVLCARDRNSRARWLGGRGAVSLPGHVF